jgi:hypothetical protein
MFFELVGIKDDRSVEDVSPPQKKEKSIDREREIERGEACCTRSNKGGWLLVVPVHMPHLLISRR